MIFQLAQHSVEITSAPLCNHNSVSLKGVGESISKMAIQLVLTVDWEFSWSLNVFQVGLFMGLLWLGLRKGKTKIAIYLNSFIVFYLSKQSQPQPRFKKKTLLVELTKNLRPSLISAAYSLAINYSHHSQIINPSPNSQTS